MLHRNDPRGFTVITQPAHAWLSGQLARAWGNRKFGSFEPREAVCLAAEQHDIGWLDWERAPALNPNTGRPFSFMELPVPVHTELWGAAGELAKIQSRYSALLVSLHGSGLYERHDSRRDTPEDSARIKEYLRRAHAFENALCAELCRDDFYAPFVTPEVIARNRRLIGMWDYMSLLICMGLKEPITLERVPAARGHCDLMLAPVKGDMTQVAVSPWPFNTKSLQLQVEGRRLPNMFTDPDSMRAALANAEWLTILTRLRPAARAPRP